MINTNSYDVLIQKISSLINTLDKYVSGLSNQPMSAVDLVTLISAILAAIISGFSIYLTIICDKKTRESNERIAEQVQAAENMRAEAEIDANLTANARIEWIQNVRQATAELIIACYRYMWSKSDEQKINWEVAQEKKALYVLYFGPDDDGLKETIAKDLLDKKTNKGKNDQLVSFVNELFSNMRQYHYNDLYLKSCTKELSECSKCYFYEEEIKVYNCVKDEYDTQFDEEDCTRFKTEKRESFKSCSAINQNMLTNLQQLSEIMRIYAKIEWNRAKHGK